MAYQDPLSRTLDTTTQEYIPDGRVERPCPGKWRLALAITLGFALLAMGCVRFKYDETATAVPAVAPLPTSSPIATSPTPQDAVEDETQTPTIGEPMALRMEPSVVDLTVGEARLVQIWLDNVENLHGVEIHIDFEPRIVHIEDADPSVEGVQIDTGTFPAPVQVMRNEVDNEAGHIVYQVTLASEEATSGSGMVASFTIRAMAEGGSPLKFTAAGLGKPGGEALPVPEQIDGIVIIDTGEPVAEQTSVPRAAASPSPPPGENVHHTVQTGENLFRIALRYGTTVEAIVVANHLPDANSVRAGQELLIPVSRTGDTRTYVVQAGDTLYSIARHCGTSVEALASLNGIGPSDTIAAGQILRVP